jgi:hypothetical protein
MCSSRSLSTLFASEVGFGDNDIAALAESRRRAGDLLDHVAAVLPSPADLPSAEIVRRWHEDLVRADQLQETANTGPVSALRITPEVAEHALDLADALHSFASSHPIEQDALWLSPVRLAAIRGETGGWAGLLRERLQEWAALDAERLELARRSVELPPGILDSFDAREAVVRAAAAERLWPMLSIGKGAAKALVATVRLDGAAVRDDDTEGWRHVAAVMQHHARRQEVAARWQTFASEVGAPVHTPHAVVTVALTVMRAADNVFAHRSGFSIIVSETVALDHLSLRTRNFAGRWPTR